MGLGRRADRTILMLANRASPIPRGKEGGNARGRNNIGEYCRPCIGRRRTARWTAELGRVHGQDRMGLTAGLMERMVMGLAITTISRSVGYKVPLDVDNYVISCNGKML